MPSHIHKDLDIRGTSKHVIPQMENIQQCLTMEFIQHKLLSSVNPSVSHLCLHSLQTNPTGPRPSILHSLPTCFNSQPASCLTLQASTKIAAPSKNLADPT